MFKAALAIVLAGTLSAGCAAAEKTSGSSYPSETVRIIAPFAAGGISDATARAVADCLEDETGGTFIVENKDGGGGVVGMTEVANAATDGSVLAVASASTAGLVPMVTKGAKYSGADFDPIRGITLAPSVLVVASDSEFRSAEDLLDAAEKQPERLSVAMPGAQGIFALAMNALAESGPSFSAVPFESNDQSVAAILSGNADAGYVSTSPTLLKQVEADQIRVLATGAPEPVPYLPEVPTFDDLGYSGLPDSTVSVLLVGPKGLDDEPAETLDESMAACADGDSLDVLGKEFVRDDEPDAAVMRKELQKSEAEWREALGS